MHIWGPIFMHPLTYPLANEITHSLVGTYKLLLVVYGAVLEPTVEDFKFLFDHIQ